MTKVINHFLRDIAGHSMEVKHEEGLYRHLSFTNNGSSIGRFDLTTWPGHLCISGDMGCFVFRREMDMFTFFRDEVGLSINPGYWAEKIQMGASPSSAEKAIWDWDPERFEQRVVEEYRQWLEGGRLPSAVTGNEVREAIRDDVMFWSNVEHEAYEAINDFDHPDASGLFQDFLTDLGQSCHDYTHHYLWCCYAIVWGIRQYDQLQAKGEAA